jgi:cyanophycinase-like exopeptidase
VSGAIALVGSGEFTPALESIDRELLAATGRRRPRVVIVAVAAGQAEAAERVAEIGRQHFAALGAEVEPLAIHESTSANDPANAQAVGEADLVYLVGPRSNALCGTLAGSSVGRSMSEMNRRGGAIAGCGAGAIALGAHELGLRRRIGWPFRVRAGLGLVPGVAIMPAYDARPEVLRLPPILRAPRGTLVLGIDRETALLGDGALWQVQGRGRVTVWHGRRRSRHRDGEILRIDPGRWPAREADRGEPGGGPSAGSGGEGAGDRESGPVRGQDRRGSRSSLAAGGEDDLPPEAQDRPAEPAAAGALSDR